MYKIIKLNKRGVEQLAQIDFESEHKRATEHNISKAYMKKEIIKRFNQGNELFFGYKINKELVGYVTLKLFFPGYKHCEVYWLAVKKKYQRERIGTRLMQFIEQYARRKGFRKVCLYTGKDMKKVRKFYEKLSYRFINEFPKYYGYRTGNTTAILYYKEL